MDNILENLSEEAAHDFLFFCRISYFNSLIGRYEFLARMRTLHNLSNPEGRPWRYAEKVLENEGWTPERDWKNLCQSVEEEDEELKSNTSRLRGDSPKNKNSDMSFLTDPSMKFKTKWDFHKGDADPAPSVPHGHEVKQDKRKLDAYRGFIYFQGHPDGRESRESIIRLWNDSKFREFAKAAIIHFTKERPDWTWDRDPLIIPAIRHRY